MKAGPIVGAIILGYAGEVIFLKKYIASFGGPDIAILGISHGLAIAVTLYVRYLSRKEFKALENKFAHYLEDLDKKNYRLETENFRLKKQKENGKKY
jgi:hypothetical protein